MARWFIDASLPFDASNSIFYQPMLDAVCAYGSGYKRPNFNSLRGPLLTKCVEEARILLMDFVKLGGKLVAQLWLMDGLIGREGPSSTSWCIVPKVLSFSSQLMPLKVPKL